MAKKFQDLSPNLQMGIVALVSVLLAVAIYVYWASPIADERDTLTAQVKALRAQNQTNRIFDQQRQKNRARIAELKLQLEELSAVVPAQEDSEGFISTIQNASLTAEIHIRSLIALPLVEREGYTEEPFKAHVDGAYFPMLDFFGRLAHGARIVNVTITQLTDPKGGGQGHFTVSPDETVGADCLFTTYFNSSKGASQSAVPSAKK
ncbi:MAG TPA: type 4a pilus biogenesis protein PilO [Terriglobia bacterium]|nr:type 4a pilus biogenesis protein PilO [Terriglobia bacterium]